MEIVFILLIVGIFVGWLLYFALEVVMIALMFVILTVCGIGEWITDLFRTKPKQYRFCPSCGVPMSVRSTDSICNICKEDGGLDSGRRSTG